MCDRTRHSFGVVSSKKGLTVHRLSVQREVLLVQPNGSRRWVYIAHYYLAQHRGHSCSYSHCHWLQVATCCRVRLELFVAAPGLPFRAFQSPISPAELSIGISAVSMIICQ